MLKSVLCVSHETHLKQVLFFQLSIPSFFLPFINNYLPFIGIYPPFIQDFIKFLPFFPTFVNMTRIIYCVIRTTTDLDKPVQGITNISTCQQYCDCPLFCTKESNLAYTFLLYIFSPFLQCFRDLCFKFLFNICLIFF
jgi:hypothetical protein